MLKTSREDRAAVACAAKGAAVYVGVTMWSVRRRASSSRSALDTPPTLAHPRLLQLARCFSCRRNCHPSSTRLVSILIYHKASD